MCFPSVWTCATSTLLVIVALTAPGVCNAAGANSTEVDSLRGVAGANSTETNEVLQELPQIPKCCPVGESYLELSTTCVKTNLSFEPEFWSPDGVPPPNSVDLLVGSRCKYGSYRLEPQYSSEDEFQLLPNGYLHVPYHIETDISPFDYCLENFMDSSGWTLMLPLVCFPPPEPLDYWKEFAMALYPIGCLVSVPFLVATILVYTRIKELRGMQGKILSCYAFCLTMAYLCLAFVQLQGAELQQRLCVVVAFMIQFFFIACFFWLNVMCHYTWMKLTSRMNKGCCKRKNLLASYFLYGWGCPVAITAVSLIMDLSPTIPASYVKPNFGMDTCWFRDEAATFSYFYGPISVLLGINIVFFVLTLRHLGCTFPKKQRITHFSQAVTMAIYSSRKQMFTQCLTLFCVMGLNWVLEVLSWSISKPPQFWIIVDAFNTLQGCVVFLIFVVLDVSARKLVAQHLCSKKEVQPNEQTTPLKPAFHV